MSLFGELYFLILLATYVCASNDQCVKFGERTVNGNCKASNFTINMKSQEFGATIKAEQDWKFSQKTSVTLSFGGCCFIINLVNSIDLILPAFYLSKQVFGNLLKFTVDAKGVKLTGDLNQTVPSTPNHKQAKDVYTVEVNANFQSVNLKFVVKFDSVVTFVKGLLGDNAVTTPAVSSNATITTPAVSNNTTITIPTISNNTIITIPAVSNNATISIASTAIIAILTMSSIVAFFFCHRDSKAKVASDKQLNVKSGKKSTKQKSKESAKSARKIKSQSKLLDQLESLTQWKDLIFKTKF